jgi:hypothetical protein
MAVSITLTPKQQQQVAEATETVSTADPRVDEYKQLLDWAAAQKKSAKMVRLAELVAEFKKEAEAFEDEPEKEDITFEGEKFRLKFGKRAKVRNVTKEGKELFANKVGEEAFLEVATIPLSAIDQYVAKADQADYIDESWGARTPAFEAKMPEPKEKK